jgi:hypothetical protein
MSEPPLTLIVEEDAGVVEGLLRGLGGAGVQTLVTWLLAAEEHSEP